jgi:glutamate/aspartate transport system substrate-binding protein
MNFAFGFLAAGVIAALSIAPLDAKTLPSLQKIQDSGHVVLGVRESSFPLSYAVEPGRYVGYHTDICLHIVDAVKTRLSRPDLIVEYQPVTSQSRIPAVVSGAVDMECGSTTNNAERRAQVDFAPTTYVTQVRAAVKRDSRINALGDLSGLSAATTRGSTSIALMEARQSQAGFSVHELLGEDHAASFKLLEAGAAQAFIMDDNIVAGLIATSPKPSDFRMIQDFIAVEPIGIMYRKNDPEFHALVDETVRALMRSGTIDVLYLKWFQSPIPPKGINLNMPMSSLLRQMIKYPNNEPLESFRPPE